MKKERPHPRTGIFLGVALIAIATLIISLRKGGVLAQQTGAAAIIDAAAAFEYRGIASRVVGLSHRPLRVQTRGSREVLAQYDHRALLSAAARAHDLAIKEPSVANVHAEGLGQLLVGDRDAASVLERAIEMQSDEPTPMVAIRKSVDSALLTDLSAAEYVRAVNRDDGFALLLAIEASERAWRLDPTPESAWNRALAIERLGIARPATRAWNAYLSFDSSREWREEAKERIRRFRDRITARPADVAALAAQEDSALLRSIPLQLAEQYFEAELAVTANDLGHLAGLRRIAAHIFESSGDQLPRDTVAAVWRSRSQQAFQLYASGLAAFDRHDLGRAQGAFAQADLLLASDRNPFYLAARFQRIRCECSQAAPSCLLQIRLLRERIPAGSGYTWLSARSAAVEGQALWNKARVYEAVNCFERALHQLERLHDDDGAGWTHMLLANALATAGESDLSLSHQMTCLRWCVSPSDVRKRQVIEESALLFLRRDAVAAATLMIDELHGTPGAPAGRVLQLAIEGLLRARSGDSAASATSFDRARRLLPDVGEGDHERLGTLLSAAEVATRRYVPAQGGIQLTAAIQKYRASSESVWLPQLLLERGNERDRQGDLRGAEADYREAMSLLERSLPRVDGLLIGAGMDASSETVFDKAIRLMLRERRIKGALDIAEHANALHISAAFAEEGGLHDTYLSHATPPTGDPVAEAKPRLGPDRTIVVYHLLNDALITWVVSQRDIVAFREPVRAEDLVADSRRLREHAEKDDRSSPDVERLSQKLLSPWIQRVTLSATLIFIPPPELGAIPFAMLNYRNHPLVERNAISVASSLRAFVDAAAADRARAAAGPAFFAAAGEPSNDLPPLPMASEEALAAAGSYPDHTILTNATRRVFLPAATRFTVIHFAGHALVNEHQPLLSALVFDDELLYVHELTRDSFPRARMIVLSACSTGQEPRPSMSIATALLRQGIPSVVYTLWAVSDSAAAEFAGAFHRRLAAGRSRADALRDAQLSMLHGRTESSSPAAWAAFQLAGDPETMSVMQ